MQHDTTTGDTAQASAPAVVVRLRPDRIVVPQECACCGAAPSRSVREARLDGRGILVPYCTDCHAHVSRERTRVLATSVSSILVGATLASGVPLLFQPPSIAVYVLVVATGALVPILVARLLPRPVSGAHAAAGRAVFFQPGGALVCLSGAFGARLAQASGAVSRAAAVRSPTVAGWALLCLLAVVALCPLSYELHFPEVRVVNLTDGRLTLLVDGKSRALVRPTSAESGSAGVVLRVPAGLRELRAVGADGRVVDVATVLVRGGAPHLYAPGSAGTCFWVETTGYGRSRDVRVPDEPLTGAPRFWVLSTGIDYWFAPAPAPEGDGRSTGGLLRALRQAPCDQRPHNPALE